MGQTLATWRGRVRAILGNPATATISDADLEEFVRAAVRRFSNDRPRITFANYPGDGVTFDLAVPASWVAGFSSPRAVEYPQGEREPIFLDAKEITLYPDDSAPTHVRLMVTTPSTGKTARLYYSLPWPIPDATAATDLIAATDTEPVAMLGAHHAALELAARASGKKNPTIPGADLFDWAGEEERWRKRAADLLDSYETHLGIGAGADGGGKPPASGWLDWDARSSWVAQGRRFLLRGRR